MSDARPDAGPYQPRRYAGLRRMTPPLYRSAEEAEAFEGLPQGMTPWDVFWHLDRAAVPMGFSRVEIDTLRVLFKFSQAQDWAAGSRPIVWPANDTLMLELGLSRTALKYRLRCLASKGLIAFRDSPTGKRYGHRDHEGVLILSATFGIDLSPALARMEACERAAARHEMEQGLRRELRRRRTIAVKAVRQAIEVALEYDLPVDLAAPEAGLRALPDVADPWTPIRDVMDAVAEVEGLRDSVEGAVKEALGDRLRRQEDAADGDEASVHDDVNLDPAGPADRPHIHITTESYIDKSNYGSAAFRKERRPASDAARSSEPPAAGGSDGAKPDASGQTDRHGHGVDYISRSMALKLMPEAMREFLAEAVPNPRGAKWSDLVNVAYWHLAALGISEIAWQQACAEIGRNGAAIAVFIIAAKRDEIRKPDRYLRSMAYRAAAGELQLHRSAWGILKGGLGEAGHA